MVAEAVELPEAQRALHLLSGVRRIIGAATAGSVTDCDFAPGSRGAFTAVTLDGWDRTTIRAVQGVAVRGSSFHPGVRALMNSCPATPGAIVTRTRETLVDDRSWYSSEFFEDLLAPGQLDHGIFSSLRGGSEAVVHGLGFYRERGDRPFSEADRALVELFHAECARLLWPRPEAVQEARVAGLAPRERATLTLLLEGCSDKEIAARLGISPFTVNQYNKSIYRRFGVQSRAALMAKLLGSARPAAR